MAEVDAGWVELVDRHRLSKHRDVGVVLGKSLGRLRPRLPAVVRPIDSGVPVDHEATLVRLGHGDRPDGLRVAGVGTHREAELGWQPLGDLLPLAAAVGRSVDAAVVLLVQVLTAVRGHDELVHALPEVGVLLALRHEPGAHAGIARLPRSAAVLGLEGADRGDADPDPIRVIGRGHDGVEDQAAISGLPLGPARMVREALDVGPRLPAVAALEQAGGLHACIQSVRPRREVPDRRDLLAAVAVAEALAGVGPGPADIRAAPDGGSVPVAATAGIQRPGLRIDDRVMDGPAIA